MKLSRRGFLKGLVAVSTLPALSKVAQGAEWYKRKTFDYNGEYGNSILTTAEPVPKEVMEFLIKDANLILPKGLKYRIVKSHPQDYGRMRHVAWYYNPYMQIHNGINDYTDLLISKGL